jgi:hypothetical protein
LRSSLIGSEIAAAAAAAAARHIKAIVLAAAAVDKDATIKQKYDHAFVA